VADNYVLFSYELRIYNSGALQWVRSILTKADAYEGNPDLSDKDFLKTFPNWPSTPTVGFQWSVEGNDLWLYSEEHADMESVASFLQAYLRKSGSTSMLGVEWAETCNRPHVGEFGGGAVMITAKTIKWMTTAKWITGELKRPRKKKSSK
jgi:hypothetical protein